MNRLRMTPEVIRALIPCFSIEERYSNRLSFNYCKGMKMWKTTSAVFSFKSKLDMFLMVTRYVVFFRENKVARNRKKMFLF